MRIFLAGATGVIGQRLAALLHDAKHEVTGTTRRPVMASMLRALGVAPVVVDVFEADALAEAVKAARPDVIIHQLTDLPAQTADPEHQRADEHEQDELRHLAPRLYGRLYAMHRFGLVALFAFASCMLTGFAQRPADDQPDMKIDAATRTQVIETLVKNLNDSYVFPDVAKQMGEAVRGRLQKGEYDQMTGAAAFAKALTEHLQAVSHDKHLRVRYSNEAIPAQSSNRREPSPEERQNMLRYYGTVNYGFEKIERMAGNIGYLDLRGFAVADMAGDTLAAAMNFVGNTEALIIDLRQNGGGDPAMVTLLCSYLFGQEPVHINDLYWREGNRTEEFWTKKSVPGKRYEGKDVYVLTSNRTFSGGEEFAYDMKNLKRATLVGETTGGGANPGVDPRQGLCGQRPLRAKLFPAGQGKSKIHPL